MSPRSLNKLWLISWSQGTTSSSPLGRPRKDTGRWRNRKRPAVPRPDGGAVPGTHFPRLNHHAQADASFEDRFYREETLESHRKRASPPSVPQSLSRFNKRLAFPVGVFTLLSVIVFASPGAGLWVEATAGSVQGLTSFLSPARLICLKKVESAPNLSWGRGALVPGPACWASGPVSQADPPLGGAPRPGVGTTRPADPVSVPGLGPDALQTGGCAVPPSHWRQDLSAEQMPRGQTRSAGHEELRAGTGIPYPPRSRDAWPTRAWSVGRCVCRAPAGVAPSPGP